MQMSFCVHPHVGRLPSIIIQMCAMQMLFYFQVLQSFKIMDYSLLLAIHNIDQAEREKVCVVKGNPHCGKGLVDVVRAVCHVMPVKL